MLFSRLCRSRALYSLTETCKRPMLQSFNVDLNQSRPFSRGTNKDEQDSANIPAAVSSKFKVFKDEESPVILDIEEERRKYQELNKNLENPVVEDEFSGINLQRKNSITCYMTSIMCNSSWFWMFDGMHFGKRLYQGSLITKYASSLCLRNVMSTYVLINLH